MLGTDDNRTDHCWLMLCSIFLPSISLFFGRLKQRPLKGSVYFLSRSQSFNLGWYHKYLISLSSKKKNLISLIYFFIFFAYGGFSNSLSLSLQDDLFDWRADCWKLNYIQVSCSRGFLFTSCFWITCFNDFGLNLVWKILK